MQLTELICKGSYHGLKHLIWRWIQMRQQQVLNSVLCIEIITKMELYLVLSISILFSYSFKWVIKTQVAPKYLIHLGVHGTLGNWTHRSHFRGILNSVKDLVIWDSSEISSVLNVVVCSTVIKVCLPLAQVQAMASQTQLVSRQSSPSPHPQLRPSLLSHPSVPCWQGKQLSRPCSHSICASLGREWGPFSQGLFSETAGSTPFVIITDIYLLKETNSDIVSLYHLFVLLRWSGLLF